MASCNWKINTRKKIEKALHRERKGSVIKISEGLSKQDINALVSSEIESLKRKGANKITADVGYNGDDFIRGYVSVILRYWL